MGITIYYRGSIADLGRVEEFEDRVLDMALELGASAQVWRSAADHDPARIVRGLMLDLSPGQETTSLLLAPEGWLVPLHDIEAAEKGEFAEPPHCCVKTQFGSIEGHVALVELLTFLKREFFPELEVIDDTDYWEHRDLPELVRKFAQSQALIDAMRRGLERQRLSAEAVEDPQIVAARVERIARQVHHTLSRPPEHAPVHFDDESPDWDELDEAHWDASYKEQRRKQERLHRAIEEELLGGVDHETAFENAMRREGIIDLPGESTELVFTDELAELDDEPQDEAWRESLPPQIRDEEDEDSHPFGDERHPLQRAASELHRRLFQLFKDRGDQTSAHLGTLMHAAGDISGGLAQALSSRLSVEDGLDRGLALVQLKRAYRGTVERLSRWALWSRWPWQAC